MKYQCGICPVKLSSINLLKRHVLNVHEAKIVKCPECGKSISEHYLPIHIEQQHRSPSIECSLCDYSNTTKENLKHHMMTCHSVSIGMNVKPKFKCELCNFNSQRNFDMEIHKARFHNILFDCLKCEYKAETSGSLKKHCQYYHSGAIFKCEFCPSIFNNEAALKKHNYLLHDQDKNNKFQCDECNAAYSLQSTLTLHIKTVHQKIKYKCEICNYEATQKTHLNSHKKSVHQGIKYPCNICNRLFTQKSHLTTHKNGVHFLGSQYPCDKRQAQYKQHLKLHIENVHMNKVYPCNLCGYKGTQIQSLKCHQRAVHGINKLICKFCNEEFSHHTVHRNHLISAHKVKIDIRSRNQPDYNSKPFYFKQE